MKKVETASQPRRLLYLILYTVIFMAICQNLFGSLLPPVNEQGFWFYTGLASLVIGSLLVTPFYTNPANGLSYAMAGLVAIIYTKPQTTNVWYVITVLLFSVVIVFSILGIATIKSKKYFLQNFSSSSRILVENFGNPRILYLFLVIYAISQFHFNSYNEIFWIFIAGLIVAIKLVELVDETITRIWNNWRLKRSLTYIGKIEAYQTPNIILIRLEDKITVKKDSLLLIKDPTFGLKLGFNLGYMGRDESILLRVLELANSMLSNEDFDYYIKFVQDNEVLVVSDDLKDKFSETNELITNTNSFLGIVDTESTIGSISIEIINEREITEGSLLELDINNQPVLYQVLDGITWEDIIAQKNKYGYSKARARKIGKWNKEENKFEVVGWMPKMNTPVFLKQKDEIEVPIEAIGTFPGTNYFVSIKDINHLVTYNTAILGILGVGKSFLSFELCERMMTEDKKVIVIDLTNQYEEKLAGFFIPQQKDFNEAELQTIGIAGRTNYQRNVEEGGSVNQFRTKIEEQLRNFISLDQVNLMIYNPLKFEIWRQTGGMFNNIAGMASLTPCEITQIITESTLRICQELGLTETSRVCLVFEEAHSLIPENNSVVGENDRHASAGTSRAILQGRKYGLGCLLITQRTANVTKTILNQCNTIFAFRNFDETGKSFLANYFGDDFSRILSTIPEQQAIVFGKASSCENPVIIQINNRDKFISLFRLINQLPELPEWNNLEENNVDAITQYAEKSDNNENATDEPF